MLEISQEIPNEIAKTTPMAYRLTKVMFSLPESKIDQAEELLMDQIQKEFPKEDEETKSVLSYRVWTVLPLLLENKAITQFITERNLPELRAVLPEILTPTEAVILIRKDHHLMESAELDSCLRLIIQLQKDLQRIQ